MISSVHHAGARDPGKPRLMIIGPFPPPFGGVANITAQLARSELREAFELRTLNICLASEKTENTGDRPVNFWKSLRLLLRTFQSLARDRPEAVLVEANGDISAFREMFVTMAYRLFSGARIVLHFHGRAKDRSSWRAFPFIKERMDRFPDRLVLNLIFSFCHSIVFLSPVLKDQFFEALNAGNRRKATWVENFVAASCFTRRHADPDGRPVVLFVGRLSRAKGFLDLLQAIPRVIERYPRTLFACCGAPETPDALDEIRELLDRYQHNGWLRLHGIVDGDRKLDVFGSADIMVYPSHFDVFPVTVLEGLAQGLPLVATPVGVLPSVLKERENAFLVKAGDPSALAERLCVLLGSADMRTAMGKANRQLAMRRFDISVATGRLHALLLGRDPDASPA